MRVWKVLVVAAILLAAAAMVTFVSPVSRGVRSVHRLMEPPASASTRFDPMQSAAVFIGVRDFDDRSLAQVPYAVDDAVDLAYVLVNDSHTRLVPANRTVLLLAGQPEKPESRDRLEALRKVGADIRRAALPDIERALRDQAARAGPAGMLVVFAASHGFQRSDTSYLLGASSRLPDPDSMLSSGRLFDAIASSRAQRSVVFIDACRERITPGVRAALASAMTAAPLLGERISARRGQAVFYAAAAGQWAYDDRVARNGVFTKAVIDGIRCGARKDRGMVTAQALAGYVEQHVGRWVRKHRDRNIGSATQSSIDGDALGMPLARCGGPATIGPDHVTHHDQFIDAFFKGKQLWHWDAGSTVLHAESVDLDADGAREVAFGTHDTLGALDASGHLLWSAHESMPLKSFEPSDLARQTGKELVALWSDRSASCIVAYTPDGMRLGEFESDRRIDRIMIAQPTSRHASRIIATSGDTLLIFDRKRLVDGKPLRGRIAAGDTIKSLRLVDGDGRRDIALTTSSGGRVVVDFNGHVISQTGARFERTPLRSRHPRGRRPPPEAPAE